MRRERDREAAEIDDGASCTKEVHADDAAERKAVVHFANLERKSIHAVIAQCESVDLANEHMLVAANAAKPSQLVTRLEVDPGIAREVG